MKTYIVHAAEMVYSCTTVQAENPEDARRMADEDGVNWEAYDGDNFNIIEVEEELSKPILTPFSHFLTLRTVASAVEESKIYIQKEDGGHSEPMRINFNDKEAENFMVTGEHSGEDYIVEYSTVNLAEDLFYKLVQVNTNKETK